MKSETPIWIRERIDALDKLMREHDFRGFDPFDLPNSPLLGWVRPTWSIPQLLLSKFGSRFAPDWFRRLLRVPPIQDPKIYACAYFGYRFLGNDYHEDATLMLSRLVALAHEDRDGVYWGYDYTWATLYDGTNHRGSSTLVPGSFAMLALTHEIIAFGGDRYRSTLARALSYYRQNHRCENASGRFLGYFTHSRTNTHNANLLGCAALSCGAMIFEDEELFELAANLAASSLAAIDDKGFIPYNDHPSGNWTDCFHHLYVTAAVMFMRWANASVPQDLYSNLVERLHRYFRNTFLRSDGLIGYYSGELDPIDPHNFAVTALFLLLSGTEKSFDISALGLLGRIDELAWNGRRRRYQFRIRKGVPDRRFFLRWTQVWMFLALAASVSTENLQEQLTTYQRMRRAHSFMDGR